MPLYAYKCNACEYACKLFHLADEDAGKCPKCNSEEFNKQYNSSASVINTRSKDDPGRRVERYIEETRAAVAEQIAEARKDFIK